MACHLWQDGQGLAWDAAEDCTDEVALQRPSHRRGRARASNGVLPSALQPQLVHYLCSGPDRNYPMSICNKHISLTHDATSLSTYMRSAVLAHPPVPHISLMLATFKHIVKHEE